jgi:malate dehydrogenase (oxaloacetate-decarboxylating)(NADP+)
MDSPLVVGLMPALKRTKVSKEEALAYHSRGPAGKIEVVPTKPAVTQRDLSLAYTPGVAEPCREIAKDPEAVFKYTTKGNLVAVISNGTAVLGLGDIGPLAAKPVMEGKGILFKRFADINVFDIEVAEKDPDRFIEVVAALEPSFGGINLEDVKAPECFYIEQQLRQRMKIPVFHDDQHGTAIITSAALLNALELVDKKPADVRIVIAGAGAAGIASALLYERLGVRRKNITFSDSKGVVYKGRKDGMNEYKEAFAQDTDARTLADAMVDADVFLGLSAPNILTKAMVKSMARDPIVFALSNPDPEISPEDAMDAREDVVIATGRSDYPNQVNNVLGFPFIFRGALDVRATQINEQMKMAAVRALADLARQDVPDSVISAYGGDPIQFGKNYLIPKPTDPRVLLWVAPAIAKAAMDSGAATIKLDVDTYREELEARLGKQYEMMRIILNKAKRDPKRIVFPEGMNDKVLRAAQILVDEKIAVPILLGDPEIIKQKHKQLGLTFKPNIVDPWNSPEVPRYAQALFDRRHRKGVTQREAKELLRNRNYWGATMVALGDADGFISGVGFHYQDALRPCLQVLGTRDDVKRVVGCYMLSFRDKVLFLADATVNIDPSEEDLAGIALAAARVARKFNIEPRVAMLSFSNFGSSNHPFATKMAHATRLVKQLAPDLMIDGEMQADTALVKEILETTYPFSTLKEPANVLVFPALSAANTAYKLLQRLANARAVGPILEGMGRPVHILQRGDAVEDIVNMAALAVVDAQTERHNTLHDDRWNARGDGKRTPAREEDAAAKL